MKNTSIPFFYALFFFLIACSDDDSPNCQGIDCLPEATQTGAGTFGCLVNGEPFVDNSGNFNCYYQLVDGEYYFSIRGRKEGFIPRNIRLSTTSLELATGETYQLVNNEEGQAHAAVIFYTTGNSNNTNTTNQNFNGSITITNLDFSNNIVSGYFEFNIEDTLTSDIYIITNGRFDAKFTQ
jgi:hypothetical protein